MTTLFDSRLRDQLLDGLEPHRRRRRRRERAMIGATAVALVVAAGLGLGLAASDDDDGATEMTDTRPAPSSVVPPSSASSSSTTSTGPPETSPDPTLILPGGPVLEPAVADQAAVVVRNLLANLRIGDVDAAMDQYQGYYGLGDARAELADLVDRAGGLLADPDPDVIVNPSFGWTDAYPVVTVVSRAGEVPIVGAFVVDGGPQEGRTDLLVQRLPELGYSDPPTGSPVGPGDTLTLDQFPTEGGARAFIGTEEIGVIIDQNAFTTGVVLPEDISGEVVLTISVATPELPGGVALWYPVAD